MTVAADNVTPLPVSLERLGRRIDKAFQRTKAGESEWIEGSLELAQALAEGRKQFPADRAFGQWLTDNEHDHVNHQDRAALIGLAVDLDLARKVLTDTTRRSYQLIWNEVQDRFTRTSKPTKPKRHRAAGKKRNRKTPPAVDKDLVSAVENDGKTQKQAGQEQGVSEQVVKTALAREEGRRETLNELLDAADVKNFSDKGALKIENAIRIHQARLDKQFEQRVNEEVRKRIEAADNFVRQENKRLREENVALQRIVGQRGVFTKAQFRQMQMLCHPDNSASEKLRAELSRVLIDNENKLIRIA